MRKRLNAFIKNALLSGCTPQRLSRSSCLGIYIAFSPFPGGHTIMMFLCNYLFKLHFPTLFVTTSINNPWTMIPFYTFDYAFGYWVVHSLMGLNPSWVISLTKVFGTGKICIWSFLLGGNILGIIVALASYPLCKSLFTHLATKLTNEEKTDINA